MLRTETSTPSFEMMNDTGSTMNESPVGTKKFEFDTMAFSPSEYFDVDSISSTCCLV